MKIELKDIIIPEKFAKSYPSDYKFNRIREKYRRGENIENDIIVNASGYLVDGYIRYLVLMENGIEQADVRIVPDTYKPKEKKKKKKKLSTYVYAKHYDSGKMYVWRICGKTKNKQYLEIGSTVLVNTQHGWKRVVVDKIEYSKKAPVEGKIRTVVECFPK